jgi:amino acid adenylation domain-containing protein
LGFRDMKMETAKYPDKLTIAASQKVKEEKYWQDRLSGELVPTYFPFDCGDSRGRRYEPSSLRGEFPGELFCGLKKLCNQSDVRLHMILVAGVVVLLNKYTGSRDVVVCAPIYRQKVSGEFTNTILLLRNKIEPAMSFRELLIRVKETIVGAVENQGYPLQVLMDRLNMPFSGVGSGLLSTAILLKNIHDRQYIRHINPNMTFSFNRLEQSLEAEVEYNARVYRRETVSRILHHLEYLLTESLGDIDRTLSALQVMSESERRQMLDTLDHTAVGYPGDTTIQCLFEEQAAKTPDHIAVVAPAAGTPGETRLTGSQRSFRSVSYEELSRQASRLAALFREKGVKPGTIVAIMMERSLEMIVGILGILKAGGAYLPIDPAYPEARVNYMLADSCAHLFLTTRSLVKKGEKVRKSESETVILEDLSRDSHPFTQPFSSHMIPSSSLAYVIYTSGTTGRPKGALIEHGNVVRLMFNDAFQFDFGSADTWTMFHSYCFDFSVWEMYGALLYGGKLVLISVETAREPAKFLDILKDQRVTVLNQTPSAFYSLMNAEQENQAGELAVRYVIFGGEALNPLRLKEWRQKHPGIKLINMFGITETTVHVTYKEIGDDEIQSNMSNIGRAIPTLKTFIMDNHLNLLPIGVPGELCVGGDGLGRGYLNRVRLTVEKFVENPWQSGERLYRSGDLARLLSNGEMEYLGRIDQQVKIRGYRIELAEIESQLLKHEKVNEAVVTVKTDERNDPYLCVYVVPVNGSAAGKAEELNMSELREYLGEILPGYMIPYHYKQLEKIPLTANGKVDRKALLTMDTAKIGTGTAYVPLRNEVEMQIAGVWKEALKHDRIGRNDNFFDLGGNSLNIIHVANKLKSAFGMEIPVVAIFEHPTIGALFQYLTREGDIGQPPGPAGVGQEEMDRFDALEAAKSSRKRQQARRSLGINREL